MSRRLRLRLPRWTAHPGFGIAALLSAGVLLVVYGEPQPSSRPSGVSVVVQDTAKPVAPPQAVLVINAGRLAWHGGLGQPERPIATPAGFRPTELLGVRGATVVLGVLRRVQHGYLVGPDLRLADLGPVDAIIASGTAGSAMVIETAVGRPGQVGARPQPSASAHRTTTAHATSATPTSSSRVGTDVVLDNFIARRVDHAGHQIGASVSLPPGTRLAADTSAGLVVWRPEKQVYDRGVALEPLSAQAILVRPDRTVRYLGPVHPLAASEHDLLVWDVVERRFGLMPLRWASSTATSTESVSASPTLTSSKPGSSPSPTPTTVAGVHWYARTRGIVVTGPASFNPDGSAFAAYAEVGARRRLVVARTNVEDFDHAEVAVLALARPAAKTSDTTSGAGTVSGTAASRSVSSSASASPGETQSTVPQFAEDGFPLAPPVTPSWWSGNAIGLGSDGTVVACDPATYEATLVDFGTDELESLADVVTNS